MVRDDVKDWPADIAGMIDEIKPIAVVALVGMNDRQLIRSDQWQAGQTDRAMGCRI